MKIKTGPRTCPYCKSDDWELIYVKNKLTYIGNINPKVGYCRKCQNKFDESELLPGKISYYLYPEHSFDTPEEVMEDLNKRLKKDKR